jgi:hypothetical protein
MEPEGSLLHLYEPQLDPALSQSSSLPQILSLKQPVEYYPTIYSRVSTLPPLNKHHIKAESGSGTALNTTLR